MAFFFVSFNITGPAYKREEGRDLADPDFVGATILEATNLEAAKARLHELGVKHRTSAYQIIEMEEAYASQLVRTIDSYINTAGRLYELQTALAKAVEHRRKLGDYDANAAAIRVAQEATLALVQHTINKVGG